MARGRGEAMPVEQMTPLPDRFRSERGDCLLLRRHGRFAIVRRILASQSEHPTFEVVHIVRQPAHHRFGKDYPAKEMMPRTESWGKMGWTYPTLEEAMVRFHRESGSPGMP